MINFKISNLNLEEDIPQIALWDEKYKGTPEYNSIYHFILEDNLYYNLSEVVSLNHERYPIGSDERKFALVAKDDKNEILGFILAIVTDLNSKDPELIIQYIVVNPQFQNLGIGKEFLSQILNNPDQYFQSSPTNVYARIDKTNFVSLNTFLHFGFTLTSENKDYFGAEKKLKILTEEKE